MVSLVNVTIYEVASNNHEPVDNPKILDTVLVFDLGKNPKELFKYLMKDIIYELDQNDKPKWFKMYISFMDKESKTKPWVVPCGYYYEYNIDSDNNN